MLHWQHKSARKRLSLWFKLALISLAGHVAALAMLFFVYRGSSLDMALTVRAAQLNSAIDVVWISQLPKGRRSTVKTNKVAPQSIPRNLGRASAERKKKEAATKSAPKTELKSEVEEKNKAKKKEVAAKLEKKKAEDKAKNKKLEKAKVEEKKPEIKKSEPEKQPEIPKKIDELPEKKSELEKSVDAIADLSPVRPAVSGEAPKSEAWKALEGQVDPLSVRPELIEGHSDEEDLNFEISGSYRDLEALQQFQELQQEISRCWRPPVGIAQTVCCQIKVTFDWEGKVTKLETVKPSGILMFDVSSRNAVAAMEAPKFVRGKTFTITFKP